MGLYRGLGGCGLGLCKEWFGHRASAGPLVKCERSLCGLSADVEGENVILLKVQASGLQSRVRCVRTGFGFQIGLCGRCVGLKRGAS